MEPLGAAWADYITHTRHSSKYQTAANKASSDNQNPDQRTSDVTQQLRPEYMCKNKTKTVICIFIFIYCIKSTSAFSCTD